MADNVELDPGTGGAVIAADDIGPGVWHQRVKVQYGVDGSATDVSDTNPLPVDDAGGSLTVDNAALSVTGGGVEASALRVTIANDSTGVLSVDDNGGSLTVDNGGTFAVQVDAAIPAGTNNIGDVDVLTVPADPFGANADAAATAGSTGSIQAKLRLMTSQLDSIKTAVETLDNTVSGSELQVDVVSSASHAVTNAGTFAVQVDGSALTALQLIDNTIVADDAAFTVATTSVNMAGFLADQSSTDSVNEGDAGAARMTLDRKQIVTVAPSADTEGLDTFRSADIDETEEDVKTSAGKLYGYTIYNDHSAEVFLQFWNATAANTTPGTTTPKLTFPLAAGASGHIEFSHGIAFDTAISVGCTAGFGDGTAPGATVSGTILYK